jgi:hypothetical protein
MRAQRAGWDLQPKPMEQQGVVVANLAILLLGQHLRQIEPSKRHER